MLRALSNRLLSLALYCIAVIALTSSTYLNFRYGWGWLHNSNDDAVIATSHALAPPAAAALVIASIKKWRQGREEEAAAPFCFALIFCLFSAGCAYNFLTAASRSHLPITSTTHDADGWAQGTVVNREPLPKVGRKIGKDIKQLPNELPDPPTKSIQSPKVDSAASAPFGFIPVMFASGLGPTITIICLIYGVLLWPSSPKTASGPAVAGQPSAGTRGAPTQQPSSTAAGNVGNRSNSRAGDFRQDVKNTSVNEARNQLSRTEAFADLMDLLDDGVIIQSQGELASRWGVNKATVSRWLNLWEKAGIVRVPQPRGPHHGGLRNSVRYGAEYQSRH